jgi:hypothetical protein
LHDFNLHNKQNPSVLLSFPDDHFKDHNWHTCNFSFASVWWTSAIRKE